MKPSALRFLAVVVGIVEEVDASRRYEQTPSAVIKVLDLRSGKIIQQMDLVDGLVALTVSPHASLVAAASYRPIGIETQIWNFESGELIGKLNPTANVFKYTSDGSPLADSFLGEHVLHQSESQLMTWRQSQEVTAMPTAFSPKESGRKLVATATEDGGIQIWDLDLKRELALLARHNGPVTALTFAPDGRSLVSGGNDSKVRFWNLTTYSESLALDLKKPVMDLKFTKSGRQLAVQFSNGEVQLLRGKR